MWLMVNIFLLMLWEAKSIYIFYLLKATEAREEHRGKGWWQITGA